MLTDDAPDPRVVLPVEVRVPDVLRLLKAELPETSKVVILAVSVVKFFDDSSVAERILPPG